MQISICIYRYICMELYQQQECHSLRLRLYWTPLGSSQRTWEQFRLVTSRPGQTGLHLFLNTNRSISASIPGIIHHLEPALQSRGIVLRKTWRTQAGLKLPITLGFCVYFIAPLKAHLSTEQLTLLCLHRSHLPLQPNHLLCHCEALQCQSGENNGPSAKSKPPPQRWQFVSLLQLEHLGTICQNAGFQDWVGFCF